MNAYSTFLERMDDTITLNEAYVMSQEMRSLSKKEAEARIVL